MTHKEEPGQELDRIARNIDEAITARDELALRSLIGTCDVETNAAGKEDRVYFRYFASNAHSALQAMHNAKADAAAWSWDQRDNVQAILCLRRAMTEPGFQDINPIFKARITTNLANLLNQLGRQIEAIELWDMALEAGPNFAMAHGNRGIGVIRLAQGLYDESHAALLIENAEQSLQRALAPEAVWDSGEDPQARLMFETRLASISEWLQPMRAGLSIDRQNFSLGDTPNEVAYRTWCLQERLFLNPLNDVMTERLAAQDVLHLPSHTYRIDEEPRFPDYYNLLKQEYVSARFRLFNANSWDMEHEADRDILLIDGADYGVFGHRLDELRLAFRAAYSLFDKIAVFLNDYFSVGLGARGTTFRRVFEKQKKGGDIEIRPTFSGSQNLPLRGLYYLSKDLFDDAFEEVAAPDAKNLASIRNQLEHRFLTLQLYSFSEGDTEEHAFISVDDFQDKTLRILRLVRAALTYLSLAMGVEEQRRSTEHTSARINVSIAARPIQS